MLPHGVPAKGLVLPKGLQVHTVPPMFEKFLTSLAWASICQEIQEQQWCEETAHDTGSALATRLTKQYQPMSFLYKIDRWVTHVHGTGDDMQGSEQVHHIAVRLIIDTRSSGMNVVIPPEIGPGQQMKVTHPMTGQEFMVTSPLDGSKTVLAMTPTETPAQPMTARSLLVEVPAGAENGAAFEIEHPETKGRMKVAPSVPLPVGAKFRCQF